MGSAETHLAPEAIAALLENRVTSSERDAARAHLSQCSRCTAVWADFARLRLDDSVNRGGTPVDPEWLRRGLAVATVDGRRGPAAAPARRMWAAVTASAAAAAAIALALWLPARERAPSPARVPEPARSIMTRMLSEDGYGGLLYAPEYLPEPRGTRGRPETNSDPVLQQFRDEFGARLDDPAIAFWLVAGAIAGGELRLADTYLADASHAHPQDVRFENLAAILAYKRGDLADAERRLRTAAARDTSGVARFNWARVLREMGRPDEAQGVLEELGRTARGARLLSDLAQHRSPAP